MTEEKEKKYRPSLRYNYGELPAHKYYLFPGRVVNYSRKHYTLLDVRSDDPKIAKYQVSQYGLYNPKIDERHGVPPEKPLQDCLGRHIWPGDWAIICNKIDKMPLKVLHTGRKMVTLEDSNGRGGRCRVASHHVMIIQDQLIANRYRQRLSQTEEADLPKNFNMFKTIM